MSRYLFGPTTAEFARDKLALPRATRDCLTFDSTGQSDLRFGHEDSWSEVSARFPAGWKPDFIALFPSYSVIPAGIWEAPIPIVVLAVDWNLLWHQYREIVPHCELVLTDPAGVEAFNALGGPPARPVLLYGCGLDDLEDARVFPRDIDVLFIGNLNPAVQSERMPWLGRLARLRGRRIVIRTGIHGADYRTLNRRARIAFNRSNRGECNMRVFEAAAAGALLFQEAENLEVPAIFADRRECIYYRDDDFESLIAHYLDCEEERAAIAAAARTKVSRYRCDRVLASVLAAIDLGALRDARKARSSRPKTLLRACELLALPSRSADPVLTSPFRSASPDPLADYLLGLLAPPQRAAMLLERALEARPDWVACGLALAEATARLGQLAAAAAIARTTLERLDCGTAGPTAHPASSYPVRFDPFRIAWERAAYTNGGDAEAEERDKRRLLGWRLHDRLAIWTNDRRHADEALSLLPHFAPAHATQGSVLLRTGRAAEAVPFLRFAATHDPFNPTLTVTLIDALECVGEPEKVQNVRDDWAAISRNAPDAIRSSSPPTSREASATCVPLASGAASRKRRIVWEGGIHSLHSFAQVNREVCTQLLKRGHEISIRIFDPRGSSASGLTSALAGCVERPLSATPELWVRHRWPPDLNVPPEGRFVLIQPWEFGSLPKDWAEAASLHAAEVWAYSQAVRDCYLAAGVPPERVHVVPLGVDPERFHPAAPPLALATRKRFKFLFVGGTISRKGFDALLESYGRAFSNVDDVCLVVKDVGADSFYTGQTSGRLVEEFRARAGAPEILYLTEPVPAERMAGLYTACDCLVLPFRGEGFGLPIAEAMACGRPTIVTDASPATDFCTPETTYFVRALRREFRDNRVGDRETVGRPWLLDPDRAALADAMRLAASNRAEARAKGRRAVDWIRSGWTWDHTVRAIEARCDRILR